MGPGLFDLTSRLVREGKPFVLATVVWRRGPSSSRVGSKAVITPDGRIRGWLGGACAEPTVMKEGRAALADGRPRLMFLGPSDEFETRNRPGVISVPMACESEGAMEVYLDPVVPRPRVVAIGRSPAADTLARLAQALNWRVTLVDDGGEPADHPGVFDVVTSLDLSTLAIDEGTFVVVATQGHYDEIALERALATKAGYVGLVASRKRADAVSEYLRGRGVSDVDLARIQAPAGLDLGSLEPEEMAVSLLAELVSIRARGAMRRGVVVEAPLEAIDPVCGMTVNVATARYVTEHAGTTYYFCAPGCQKAFERDPHQFITGRQE